MAAKEARAKVISEWEEELSLRVKEVVGERRAQAIKALGMHETVKGNKVGWFGELTPGSKVLLTYNSAQGPLQKAKTVRIHLGTDNWYKEAIEVQSQSFWPVI